MPPSPTSECGDLALAIMAEKAPRKLKGGSVRDVYALGDGTVIKVAKHPRGLEQNVSLDFGDSSYLDGKVPEMVDRGLDYIITEEIPRNDKAVRKYLKPLAKFSPIDLDHKTAPLQDAMHKLGLEDFLDYDILWNDFMAARNWGQRADGSFALIDEGALNSRITSISKPAEWAVRDWAKIKRLRRRCR